MYQVIHVSSPPSSAEYHEVRDTTAQLFDNEGLRETCRPASKQGGKCSGSEENMLAFRELWNHSPETIYRLWIARGPVVFGKLLRAKGIDIMVSGLAVIPL